MNLQNIIVKEIKIIQKGCHNWLYSPKCKDNTISIVPRLSWKQINIVSHDQLVIAVNEILFDI